MGLQTVAVHAGEDPRVQGAAVMPIFQTATFVHEGEDSFHSVRYTRCSNNPSQQALGAKLAALEGAEAALVLSSGMAAVSHTLLTLLRSGDHLLAQGTVYGGTHGLLHRELPRMGIEVGVIDAQNAGSWQAQLQPSTRVIYVEALSNPLLQVPDLRAVVAFARRHGLTSVIDATFATPVNLRPLNLGFDVVVHSGTKYLNGHSDVVAGVVVGSAAFVQQVREKAIHLGGSLDPNSCFLLSRGLKTLALRVRQQNATALALARWLHQQKPQVAAVHYPGLCSHPQHERARQLFTCGGCGGVLSFELGGGLQAAAKLLQGLRLAVVAPSLGGVETLVTRPAATSHSGLSPQERASLGIGEGLIRVAVGVEDTEDVLADFQQALAQC